MKHKPKHRGGRSPLNASTTGERQPLPANRKRLFGLIAITLPFLFLALLEVGLRLAGCGYDPAFFKVERAANGQKYLINNDAFTFRFFPPELARYPSPFKISADKPSNVLRIFILGESAAMGDPQPSVGAAHYLEILLREKFPGQKFEVVNLGITAINSHVILPIAQEVAARGHGDLWLIYMGNNEMVGPFGAATVFGARAAPVSVARLNLAIQKTRVGQLMVSVLRKWSGKKQTTAWGGMAMFENNKIPPDDARRETVYKNFARNLQDIVAVGQHSGAKILLSTMSVNLRDCPPFGSLLNSKTSPTNKTQFDQLYHQALALQTNQQPHAAVELFAEAAQRDPEFAELQFRWAQCLLNETNPAAAREHFHRACDVDALPFRADTRINAAIRSLGGAQAGTSLVWCDAAAALNSASPDSVAGDESFFEHVHFNFDGNYRLARAWAEQISILLRKKISSSTTTDWATQDTCERAIGLSDWNRRQVISSVLSRLRLPPLSAQFNNADRAKLLLRELEQLDARHAASNTVAQTQAEFAAALVRSPEDNFLRENYGNFLRAINDKPAALSEFLAITKRLPQDFNAALQAGRLLGESGRGTEAELFLRGAAAQRPLLPDAWFELGVVLASEAHYESALECFARVAELHPADSACLTHQARALSKLNRHAEAILKYREVCDLNKESWSAHLELAVELSASDQVAESIQHYQIAVRLNPRQPVMHVNLGVLLAHQNRFDEALQEFQAALQLDPSNTAASDYLRQVKARPNQRP